LVPACGLGQSQAAFGSAHLPASQAPMRDAVASMPAGTAMDVVPRGENSQM